MDRDEAYLRKILREIASIPVMIKGYTKNIFKIEKNTKSDLHNPFEHWRTY